jgi:hypothetical protein
MLVLEQNTVVKPRLSQTLLTFNMKNVDDLFPGFTLSDFAMMYGSRSVLTLSFLLAVRAQLPLQLGGLESNVIFVDGGNTFRLYKVSRLARLFGLRPRQVLQRILISRAFTAHQMTAIVLEKLEETIERHDAKMVILSDFEALYLDKDVRPDETKAVYSQVTAYLAKIAEQNSVIILATCPPHFRSRRSVFLDTVLQARSSVNIRVAQRKTYPFAEQFILEKHPILRPGCVDFPNENLCLNDFVGGNQ